MKLRPRKTVDRSSPSATGRISGEVAPPHISATVQSVSPSIVQSHIPPLISGTQSDGQSMGWLADVVAALDEIQLLPPTLESGGGDIHQSPNFPKILGDESAIEPVSDLMADIDMSIRKPFLHEYLSYVHHI